MSVFGKIPKAVEAIREFDREKPVVSIESDENLTIENYRTIRAFTESEISVDFDEFFMSIEGEGLVMNSFTPNLIKISGRILKVSYIDRR